jgi:hypothetical protein
MKNDKYVFDREHRNWDDHTKYKSEYHKNLDGTESCSWYDPECKKICTKDLDDLWESSSNMTYIKEAAGCEIWYECGLLVRSKDVDGCVSLFGYDENDMLIYSKVDGLEVWYENDRHGDHISSVNSKGERFILSPNGEEHWFNKIGNRTCYVDWEYSKHEYNEKGKRIFKEDFCGTKTWFDDNENPIRILFSDGKEIKYKYDDYGNQTYVKYFDGVEEWFKPDGLGSFKSSYNSKGEEFSYGEKTLIKKWDWFGLKGNKKRL